MVKVQSGVDTVELLKKIAEQAAEIKQLKSKKKFGLVWEDKPDAQVMRIRDEAPMLCEDTTRAVVTDQNAVNHILINGDNFHALTALRATHTGRVDVIYIDPPYNTGSKDFIYNDNYIDKEDGYRHSKWLSFMEKRLALARELMSDSGIIFVSIDDNEQSRLKLLMDDVFGPENFVGDFIWKSKSGGGNDSSAMVSEHEYILTYAKSISNVEKLTYINEELFKGYTFSDEYELSRGKYKVEALYRSSLSFSQSLVYPIIAPDGSEILPNDSNPESTRHIWRWGRETFARKLAEGRVEFKKTKNGWRVFSKQYMNENDDGSPRTQTIRSLITDIPGRNGSEEITRVIGHRSFTNPKPKELLMRILGSSARPNAIVLDFFAGSGTTGHAVAELNKEDGGTRQCILVTDGGKTEVTGESSKNSKEGAVNIAEEITYERVRRVLTGKEWTDGKEHEPLGGNLRYFKVEMESVPHGTTTRDQRLGLEKYTIEHAKIATNIFNEVFSKDELDDETLLPIEYKVFADEITDRYLVGVNAHDFALADLEEWFTSLPETATVIMVGNGVEEIEWVRKNLDRITVDDVLGRVIRSRKYVASKL